MVQSDALFWQLDLVLAGDTDNENRTLLLDNMFINLLDVTLQEQVLDMGQVDSLLKEFSIDNPAFAILDNWKLEMIEGRNTLFYKGWNLLNEA